MTWYGTQKTIMTVGFLFTGSNNVLLVRKRKPDWQEGLWNGVGGKAEPGERPIDCHRREFREETGLDVSSNWIWRHFAVEITESYELHAFSSRIPEDGLMAVSLDDIPSKNDAGEDLAWTYLGGIWPPVVGNLRWMLPLARDWRPTLEPVVFRTNADIRRKASW